MSLVRQEKSKTMLMQNFAGTKKAYYGKFKSGQLYLKVRISQARITHVTKSLFLASGRFLGVSHLICNGGRGCMNFSCSNSVFFFFGLSQAVHS